MVISYNKLITSNLVYCYIPVFLFLLGWCRWEIAVPLSILLAFLFYRLWRSQADNQESFVLHRPVALIFAGVSLLMALVFGYGGIFASFHDYTKHSAVVQDLVTYSWPVLYQDAPTPSLLTYYIGSYLFPALVGKVFASRIIGEIMMGVMGWIGMILLFVNVIHLTKAQTVKQQTWALVIFIFFNGLLLPAQLLMHPLCSEVDLGSPHWYIFRSLQIRSSMVAMKWVWQQYYIPILGLAMLYHHRHQPELYAVWILPAFICGTWSFLTLFIYVVAYWLVNAVRTKTVQWSVISWQNILCTLVGVLMLFYFAGTITSDKPDELKFHLVTDLRYYLLAYLPFCLFMFGIYFMLIWSDTRKSIFFYTTLVLLCVIPFFHAGLFNDWVMGTSMPAFFLLAIYCIRFLIGDRTERRQRAKQIVLAICIAISASYTCVDLYNTFSYSHMPQRTLAGYSNNDGSEDDLDYKNNYFSYNYQESLFFRHIARKQH